MSKRMHLPNKTPRDDQKRHCLEHLFPDTAHLTIPSSLLRRIVRIQHPHLALIRLTERITPLLPHPLHLPNLSDRLLELLHPRPVVLDIVLLDLLDVVVCLRGVHALGVLVREVPEKTQRRQKDDEGVEDRRAENDGDDIFVFCREADGRCDGAEGREEDEPDEHAARNGHDGVFGPDVGYKSGFAENDGEHGGKETGAPDPVTANLAVGEDEIIAEDELAEDITQDRVVEAVCNPGPERVHAEECAFLAEEVELRVSV